MQAASFDSLFGIVELSLRCGGGRNSEDEIDRQYSCTSKHQEMRSFLERGRVSCIVNSSINSDCGHLIVF